MNQKWKTLIVSVLTPSSIISGIALIVLWGYFSRLDRLDIFFDVMNIKSILVLVCCTTILSLIMIIFIFFITSFFIPIVIPYDIKNLPAYNKIQGNFLSDYSVQAVSMFTTNQFILLCPKDIIRFYRESWKFDLLNVDFDTNTRKKLQEEAAYCVPISAISVKRWDMPLQGSKPSN